MADDTIITTANSEKNETPAAAAPQKKPRAPRRPKAAAQTAVADAIDTPAKKTRAKRGAKQVAAKGEKAPTRAPTRAPSAKPTAATVATVGTFDDIADLIKLDEENKQLRKELADKLRSENADLRKRLGKA